MNEIRLMPEPGTPAAETLRKWLRQAWADPRNVAFRANVGSDAGTVAFLTQGGAEPLPEIVDPTDWASEISVTLLVDRPGNMDDDRLMEEIAEFLVGRKFGVDYITIRDVNIPDLPRGVRVLNSKHYRAGDHFINPLPQEEAADAKADR